ncbi:hypothetical protein D3C74_70740 [compost metagenome]
MGNLDLHGVAKIVEHIAQGAGTSRQPDPFRSEVGDINQVREPAVGSFACFACRVVTQISSHVDIGLVRAHRVKQGIAGTAAKGDLPDDACTVSGDTNTASHRWEHGVNAFSEILELHRLLQEAHPPQAFLWQSILGLDQRHAVLQPEGIGEGVVDSPDGAVGIGVRRKQCGSGFDQAVNGFALEIGGGNLGDSAQEQWVVSDQQIGPTLDCILDHLQRWINSHHDLGNLLAGTSGHQANGIPIFGQ